MKFFKHLIEECTPKTDDANAQFRAKTNRSILTIFVVVAILVAVIVLFSFSDVLLDILQVVAAIAVAVVVIRQLNRNAKS